MSERKRSAIDIAGYRVELVERDSLASEPVADDPSIPNAHALFGPDNQPLIDEGDGFYRSGCGVRFKLTD